MTTSGAGVHTRPIEAGEELAAAWRLAGLAFGFSPGAIASRSDPSVLPAGQTWWGAFDESGRVIGVARDIWHDQWWGGRCVPAADVSAVAVIAEARGRGVGRALMKAVLEGAYERGAAVSALYPTASPVYRASGWASCGQLRSVELPTAMLPTRRTPSGGKLTVRPADPSGADQPAVADLYTRVARTREGLLSRQGPPFNPAQTWPEGIDGMTLVEEDGKLVGYASWVRGSGYRSEAILDVPDLLATSTEAGRELLAVLAGWRSVTPTVRLRLLDFDPLSQLLPVEAGTRFDARPWMHRPVDVARAVSGRGWPLSRRGKVTLHLHDPVAPWNDGAWEFDVADGDAVLSRTATHPDLRLHVAGFALLFCGVATPAMLLEAGLLHGPTDGISGLELIRPKSAAQLLDYF